MDSPKENILSGFKNIFSKKRTKEEYPRPLLLRFSSKEQVLFTKRLAVLIQAGVPILNALRIMRGQSLSRGAKYIITKIINEVERGQFLSSGLRQFESIFGEFAINIIQVGEISGTLHDNLEYLSEELKKRMELKRKITSAFIYPSIIVVATLGIIILLTAYVFPKILPVFESFTAELPWSTRALIFLSSLFTNQWAYLLGGSILFVVIMFILMRIPTTRVWIDKKIIRIPCIDHRLVKSSRLSSTNRWPMSFRT